MFPPGMSHFWAYLNVFPFDLQCSTENAESCLCLHLLAYSHSNRFYDSFISSSISPGFVTEYSIVQNALKDVVAYDSIWQRPWHLENGDRRIMSSRPVWGPYLDTIRGWTKWHELWAGDSSVVKSTYFSSRGPNFSSQYVHGGSQLWVTPVSGYPTLSSGFCG